MGHVFNVPVHQHERPVSEHVGNVLQVPRHRIGLTSGSSGGFTKNSNKWPLWTMIEMVSDFASGSVMKKWVCKIFVI